MKKVLIVEDNADTLKVLEKLVQNVNSHAKVFLADDIEKGYAYVMKYTMDVFIVDLMLEPEKKSGDMSGAELIQKIREIKKYYFTPIIIVTSLYDTKQYLYSKTHCFQFVEKPFDQRKMQAVISDAMKYTTKNTEEALWFYKIDGMVGAIPVGDIIYARSKRQEMNVVTVKEKIQISYKTCAEMLDELDADTFEMCKRGTIVNRKYIKRIDSANRYIYLYGCEDVLEIGSVMKKRFLEWFYEEE